MNERKKPKPVYTLNVYDEVDDGYRGYLQFYLSDDKEPFEAKGGLVHDCYVVVSEKKMGPNWLHIYFASNEIRDKYSLFHYRNTATIRVDKGLKLVGPRKKWRKMVTENAKRNAGLNALEEHGYSDIKEIHPAKLYFGPGVTLKCSKGHKFLATAKEKVRPEVVPYSASDALFVDKNHQGSLCVEHRYCPVCNEHVNFAYDWVSIILD